LLFKIYKGEKGTEFFIVEEGVAEIIINKQENENYHNEISVGEYFGEVSLLREVPRTANVIAKVY